MNVGGCAVVARREDLRVVSPIMLRLWALGGHSNIDFLQSSKLRLLPRGRVLYQRHIISRKMERR